MQAACRSVVQKLHAALGDVRTDLLPGSVPQVPQLASQVDEGHGGPEIGRAGADHGRAEVVISWLTAPRPAGSWPPLLLPVAANWPNSHSSSGLCGTRT